MDGKTEFGDNPYRGARVAEVLRQHKFASLPREEKLRHLRMMIALAQNAIDAAKKFQAAEPGLSAFTGDSIIDHEAEIEVFERELSAIK
jgi:hypothetical protein